MAETHRRHPRTMSARPRGAASTRQKFADKEIRAFIERLPAALGYRAAAARCRKKFGRDRAWSADEIRVFWLKVRWDRRRFKWKRDAKVKALIEDLLGRRSIPEILAECRRRFGAARTPSRSTLYDLLQQYRGVYRLLRRRGAP